MKNCTKPLSKISVALFSLVALNLSFLPAIAATPKQAPPQPAVTCKPKKLGYEEAVWLSLKKPQGEYSEPGTINLYEDAVLQVLAKGIENLLYVRVIGSKSPKDKGLEGWVNANALNCNNKLAKVKPALCEVTGVRSGQLALRATPGGKSKAGLDNANNVDLLKSNINTAQPSTISWIYVRVTNTSNRKIQGMEGWINSDFVICYSNLTNDAISYP
jgi:RNase P/RNase MRP subunit p29